MTSHIFNIKEFALYVLGTTTRRLQSADSSKKTIILIHLYRYMVFF